MGFKIKEGKTTTRTVQVYDKVRWTGNGIQDKNGYSQHDKCDRFSQLLSLTGRELQYAIKTPVH